MKTWTPSKFFVFFMLLLLLGCKPIKPTMPTSSNSASPKVTLIQLSPTSPITSRTITPIPSPTPFYVFTPYPTQSPKQIERMTEILKLKTCVLPCYLGITPGKTTLYEAKSIVEGLGAIRYGGYQEADLPVYDFILEIKDVNQGSDYLILHHVGMVVGNRTVQRTILSVNTVNSHIVPLFQNYWSRYSVREILLQQGLPDLVVVQVSEFSSRYGLVFVYENKGIVAEIGGTKEKNIICPEIEKKYAFLRLTLTNLVSGLSVYDPNWVPPTDREVWSPIEEVLGMDKQKFYDQIIADPEVCFEVKTSAP